MGVSAHIPAALVSGALIATALLILVSCVLGWHGLRRLLDVPRVPRPSGMYVALAALWGLLATISAVTTTLIVLLRDHSRLDGRTEIGEVRCQATGPGHARVEIRPAAQAPSLPAETYDVDGDVCTVAVKQVELRPGLRAFGVGALARVDAVRPAANATPLGPAAMAREGVLKLIVQRTRSSEIVVQPDSTQRFTVVAGSGEAPALRPILPI